MPIVNLNLWLFLVVGMLSYALRDDQAAIQYLMAISEIGQVPSFVDAATTDNPEHGFAKQLSSKQRAYLNQYSVQSALTRFDNATQKPSCQWYRYETNTWTDGNLNSRCHQLARVVLLRARANYERGDWLAGNRDVESVRILARRMTEQARFFEHQCFMIENMAIGTAAAFLPQMPQLALEDLSRRNNKLGVFSPMKTMLLSECLRLKNAAKSIRDGQLDQISIERILSPYLNLSQQQSLRLLDMKGISLEFDKLSEFLSEFSTIMDLSQTSAKEQAANLFQKHAAASLLVSAFQAAPLREYRENAQAICRGNIFNSVLNSVKSGQADLSHIPDPYGGGHLMFHKKQTGFLLESQLKHHSRIGLRFGHAAKINP